MKLIPRDNPYLRMSIFTRITSCSEVIVSLYGSCMLSSAVQGTNTVNPWRYKLEFCRAWLAHYVEDRFLCLSFCYFEATGRSWIKLWGVKESDPSTDHPQTEYPDSIQCIKRYGWKCCIFPRAHAIHHDNFSPRIVYLNFKRGQGNFSLANGTVATCVSVNKELPPALTEESLRGYEELAVPFDDCGTNRTDGNTAWDTARLYFRRKNLKGVISV